MNAIPLGETVSRAYDFLLSRITSIVGIAWLPLLIGSAATIAATAQQLRNPSMAGMFLAGMMVVLLTNCMVTVGTMQLALSQRKGAWIYFSLGAPVWRLLATTVLVWLVLILIIMLMGLALYLAWTFSGMPGRLSFPRDLGVWAMFPINQFMVCNIAGATCPSLGVRAGLFVFTLLEFCAFVYMALRLTFFIPAVAVAEESMSLGRSWTLSEGNFWRILGIYVAVALPIIIIAWMATYIASAPFIAQGISRRAPETLAVAKALEGAPGFLIVTLVITMVQQTLSHGVMAGAVANAYNAATEPVTTGLRAA